MRIHEKPAKSIAQALNRAMEALVKDEYLKHTNVNAQALCLEDTSNENMVTLREEGSEFSPPPLGGGQVPHEQRTNWVMQEYGITQEKTCDDKDEQKESRLLCKVIFSGGPSFKIGMHAEKGKIVIKSEKCSPVVDSMDFPEVPKYRALVSAQAYIEEIIQDLYSTHQDHVKGIVHAGMIKDHLMAFYHNTRVKPHMIIFYKDGVSERQISQVLLREIDAIRKVVASMDFPEVTKYRALVSAQAYMVDIIQDLYITLQDPTKGIVHAGMIRDHLMTFYQNTRMKPHMIIFYWDGMSEGQISLILLHEIDAIRKVVASMDFPEVTKYKAFISAHAYIEEIIQDLYSTRQDPIKGIVHEKMIRDHLMALYQNTRMKSNMIIFYRDGVSEGQISQVLLHEIDAIRKEVDSIDFPEVTKYKSLVSAQSCMEEIIEDLYSTCQDPIKGIVHAGMIRDHLMAFYHNTRMKHHRIIFYRDGVSEGQIS